jgi:hypothetical protein
MLVTKSVSKYKGHYRCRLAKTAVRCGEAKKESDALLVLAKGLDLSLEQPARAKAPVGPTIFMAHFESLFTIRVLMDSGPHRGECGSSYIERSTGGSKGGYVKVLHLTVTG